MLSLRHVVQLADLLPVVRLIVVGDETNNGCVIHELHNVVAAEGRSAVVGQHRQEQGAEHTALGGPDSGCVAADPRCHEVSR